MPQGDQRAGPDGPGTEVSRRQLAGGDCNRFGDYRTRSQEPDAASQAAIAVLHRVEVEMSPERDDPILDSCLDEVLGGRKAPDLTARILKALAERQQQGGPFAGV